MNSKLSDALWVAGIIAFAVLLGKHMVHVVAVLAARLAEMMS